MSPPTDWLKAKGEERRRVVTAAAAALSGKYKKRWESVVPIELHRLAYTLDAQIKRHRHVRDGARLLPVPGGFRVLIGYNLPRSKFRTSVAHELAHTLFYSRDSETPQQLVASSQAEEHFCFDVARHVLAPDWLVHAAELERLSDASEVYRRLIDWNGAFQLSQPIAARVMLADYQLAIGVAGRWVRGQDGWKCECSGASASPCLSTDERAFLWYVAESWLRRGIEWSGFRVIGRPIQRDSDSAFVVVVRCNST